MTEQDADLLELLLNEEHDQEEEEQESKTHVPSQVRISRGTLEKAWKTCEIVRKVGGMSYEWFSFLVASKADPEYVARDLILVPGAKVEPGHVAIDGTLHAKAARTVQTLNEINKTDLYIIGWLHSHGGGMPHHSEEDDGNFEQLLNTVYHNTKKPVWQPLHLIETKIRYEIKDGKICIVGSTPHDATISFPIPDQETLAKVLQQYDLKGEVANLEAFTYDLLSLMPMKVQEAKIVGFGYSVVVNDKKNTPYGKIGTVERNTISGSRDIEVSLNETKVEIVDLDHDVEFNERKIKKIVKRLKFTRYQPQISPFQRWKGAARGQIGFRFPFTTTVIKSPSQFDQETHGQFWNDNEDGAASRPAPVIPAPAAGPSALPTAPKDYSGTILLADLADIFVYSATSYITQWRYGHVKYAQYLDKVMGALDDFVKRDVQSLSDAIRAVGSLSEDSPELYKPNFENRPLRYIQGKIKDHLPKDAQDPEAQFMAAFTSGDKNKALETYIPLIRGERELTELLKEE